MGSIVKSHFLIRLGMIMSNATPRTSSQITRLAPSPTGALHLGNARTFLINWALARQSGWKIVLRIEDLDTPRTKARADLQAMEILRWLGIDWDGEPSYQAADLTRYHQALAELGRQGMIYPCTCTRKEIESAQSAPHEQGENPHELRYPNVHRPAAVTPIHEVDLADPQVAWRVRSPDEPIEFVDQFCGPQSMDIDRITGDFIVAAKSGLPAYQLAVVVDDAAAGVTQVVRADDLLPSTPRQLWLYRLLGLSPIPSYTHVPLVMGEDGRRLAKRHGDSRLIAYREAGVPAERVIGLIGAWCGLGPREPMSAETFCRRFALAQLPTHPVCFTDSDDAWLRQA